MDTPGTQTFVKLSSLYFSFGVSFIGGSIVNILVNLLSVAVQTIMEMSASILYQKLLAIHSYVYIHM